MPDSSTKLDILVFAPHPDDGELFCGGTLLKSKQHGYRTGICDLTRGEMGTRGTPEIRAEEAQAASTLLGLDVRVNLEIPDGGIAQTPEHRLRVIQTLREFQPHLILIPYPEDRHPDHVHASYLVKEAAFYSGLRAIDTGQTPYRPLKILYYFTHYIPVQPTIIVDVSDVFEHKLVAIQAYQSQFYQANASTGEPETYISSKTFWEGITGRASYWGSKIQVRYGEPFWMSEPVSTQNVMAILSL